MKRKHTLTLIRGLPGSGKTTLARELARESIHPSFTLEADNFFVSIDPNKVYNYDPKRAGEAHNHTLSEAMYYLSRDYNVIVANTFVQFWEMQPYVALSEALDTKLVVIDMPLGINYGSTHGVPEEIINAMWKKFQVWKGKKYFYNNLNKRFA